MSHLLLNGDGHLVRIPDAYYYAANRGRLRRVGNWNTYFSCTNGDNPFYVFNYGLWKVQGAWEVVSKSGDVWVYAGPEGPDGEPPTQYASGGRFMGLSRSGTVWTLKLKVGAWLSGVHKTITAVWTCTAQDEDNDPMSMVETTWTKVSSVVTGTASLPYNDALAGVKLRDVT